jgi:hypothetical protein
MKFNSLRAIGHNVADSLGSGICFLVGIYDCDVYGESRAHPGGCIAVDFLRGEVTSGPVSAQLAGAIAAYRDGLAELCIRHGTSLGAFSELTARFSEDGYGPRVTVIVADHIGHQAKDEYVGRPARRVRRLDDRGRVRKS